MLTGSILLAATPALAAGDAAAGEAIFKAKCSICHTNVEGKNKIGPSLWAVVGRKAGSLPGYNYSDAMKNANRTWDATTLDAYLTNPRQNIPGVKMLFVGLPNADDRANVIAYLSTLK
jgi:cytochrome c